jgi:gliding motility-associated-like protein
VKDEVGYTNKARVMINEILDILDITNGYSPNEDETNNTLIIDVLSKYPTNVLGIYNHWENLIYKKNNYDNTWAGRSKVNGIALRQDLPNGTYNNLLDQKLEQSLKSFIVIRR